MSRHRTPGPNASREIIEYALEQSRAPRGAHRSADSAGLSPGRLTLTALVAGAVTMSGQGVAMAAVPADHAQRGAVPRSAGVSQQIAAVQQKSGNLSSTQTSGLLTRGSRGPEVRNLQRVLNAWYPSQTSLAEDGIYGPKTADRVRYLQERAGLVVDGIAGPKTLGTLNMSAAPASVSQEPTSTGGNGSVESSSQDSASSAESSNQSASSAETSNQESASSAETSDNDTEAQSSAAEGAVVSPTSGQVTSSYGSRSGGHDGVDIANDIGTPIYAAMAGEVIEAGPASGFGMWVRVQHDDGTISVYGHIHAALVSAGEHVAAGEQIATMGSRGQSTGPHLHFEIWANGGQPIDPAGWLAQYGVSL